MDEPITNSDLGALRARAHAMTPEERSWTASRLEASSIEVLRRALPELAPEDAAPVLEFCRLFGQYLLLLNEHEAAGEQTPGNRTPSAR